MSLLPTPAARLGDGRGMPSEATATDRMNAGRRNLEDAVALLPTPRADHDGLSSHGVVPLLPTPSAGNFNDGEDPKSWLARREELRAKGINGNGAGTPLAVALKLLPTPAARDARGPADPEREGGPCLSGAAQDEARWGLYAPAISRWEAITGRCAPDPLDGRGRLSSAFVEWMMDCPPGWVDAAPGEKPLKRSAKLRLLGNAVVERQAEAALRALVARAREEVPA